MRGIVAAAALLCFVSSLAFAQETNDNMSFIGVIVDCKSMETHREDMQSFLPTYAKADALQPAATESGYGIYLEDDFMKFDKAGNEKIVEFLKKPESTLAVSIQALIGQDDILSLVSIENK